MLFNFGISEKMSDVINNGVQNRSRYPIDSHYPGRKKQDFNEIQWSALSFWRIPQPRL